ncbi:unnamed protein product [Rhizophagus irregularis]|nr:unnamed protein product [Rhizophagus irregularis]
MILKYELSGINVDAITCKGITPKLRAILSEERAREIYIKDSLGPRISRMQLTISESESEKHNFCNSSVKINSRNVITFLSQMNIVKRIPRAHDKLSIKFKEIAEGSKKLSVNDSFTNPIISEDEITRNIQDLHLRRGKRGHAYFINDNCLLYNSAIRIGSTQDDDEYEYEEDDYNETTLQPKK